LAKNALKKKAALDVDAADEDTADTVVVVVVVAVVAVVAVVSVVAMLDGMTGVELYIRKMKKGHIDCHLTLWLIGEFNINCEMCVRRVQKPKRASKEHLLPT
jgi:hypothetical protein